MRRVLIASGALLLAAAYVARPVKSDEPPKEQQYVRVFYCFDTKSVEEQRHAGKSKIVLGHSLSSLDPNSEDMKDCAKTGAPMMGYVQITPPFANP